MGLAAQEKEPTSAHLAGGLVIAAGGLWKAYTYFDQSSESSSSTQTSITIGNIHSGGDTVVGSGHIDKSTHIMTQNIGVPFEQYKADLAEKELEIRQLLVSAVTTEQNKATLEIELAEVERRRLNERASYEAHIKDLKERIKRLNQLKGQLPDTLINEAKQALAQGDNSKADQLFAQVEVQAEAHIAAAAEAAYQRGKLAEDAIHYLEAMRHYQRATQLAPDNTDYLNAAGIMADTLGHYDQSIGYYEQALASDLKTYGEGHPAVATKRNNLGEAWRSLGKYEKAIDYYEQALAVFQQVLGEQHPNSQVVQRNLEAAQAQLKNSQ